MYGNEDNFINNYLITGRQDDNFVFVSREDFSRHHVVKYSDRIQTSSNKFIIYFHSTMYQSWIVLPFHLKETALCIQITKTKCDWIYNQH